MRVKVTRVNVTEVRVKGRRSKSKVARVMFVGQGHRVKVKFVGGTFLPHRLAGGATRRRFHSDFKKISKKNGFSPKGILEAVKAGRSSKINVINN